MPSPRPTAHNEGAVGGGEVVIGRVDLGHFVVKQVQNQVNAIPTQRQFGPTLAGVAIPVSGIKDIKRAVVVTEAQAKGLTNGPRRQRAFHGHKGGQIACGWPHGDANAVTLLGIHNALGIFKGSRKCLGDEDVHPRGASRSTQSACWLWG